MENAFYVIPVTDELFEVFKPRLNRDNVLVTPSEKHITLLFNRISQGRYPNFMFILPIRNIKRAYRLIPEKWRVNPPANIMYELLLSDQATADELMPKFLKLNGNKCIRLCCQSSEISLQSYLDTGKIIWVKQIPEIIESVDINWLRSMRSECENSSVPYYFDINERTSKIPEDLLIKQYPDNRMRAIYDVMNTPIKPKYRTVGFSLKDLMGDA